MGEKNSEKEGKKIAESSDKDAEEDLASDFSAFFIMPVELLKSLHDELGSLVGPDAAPMIIYRCGFRSGKTVTKNMQVEGDKDALYKKLPELWIQIGLGILDIREIDDDELLVECAESNEAKAMGHTGKPSCHLTRGYIGGALSTLFSKNMYCIEEKCVSNGSEVCIFRVTTRRPIDIS